MSDRQEPLGRETRQEPLGRETRQRRAVRQVLAGAEGFRSAQELHAALRDDDARVGLTTVYRTLQGLADAGELDVLRRDDGEAVYRACGQGSHHHHVVCRGCGRTVEVEGPEVETWAAAVARRHGFDEVSHQVEVFGRCAGCRGAG